jgi:hypothetical protein
MPIPNVVTGTAATSTWANAVTNATNGVAAAMSFTPGGNTDTPNGATWITIGNLTVPTWATTAFVVYSMNGVYCIGATTNAAATLKIGAATGAVTKVLLHPGVANQRFSETITDVVAGPPTGSQSVTLASTFTTGSVVRADTTSFFTALFVFLP